MASENASDPAQLFGKKLVSRLVVPIALAALAYAALLLYGDAFAILGGVNEIPAAVIVWAILVSTGSFVVRGLRWHFYLLVMDIRVPRVDSMLLFLAGLGMSITPGKTGELLKSLLLKERHDVPIARSGPIVVAERLTDLGALLLLVGASLLWPKSPLLVVVLGSVFLIALFAFGRSRKLGSLAVAVLCLVPFFRRFRDKLLTAHASLRELWSLGSFSVAMALSVFAWGLQALTVTLFAGALHESGLTVAGALVAYAAPLLAGALALLPGGLGVTEATMAGTLRALSGMSATAAATITILTRLVTFWLALALGLSAIAIWRLRSRRSAVAAVG